MTENFVIYDQFKIIDKLRISKRHLNLKDSEFKYKFPQIYFFLEKLFEFLEAHRSFLEFSIVIVQLKVNFFDNILVNFGFYGWDVAIYPFLLFFFAEKSDKASFWIIADKSAKSLKMFFNIIKKQQLHWRLINVVPHIIDGQVILLQDSNRKVICQPFNMRPESFITLKEVGNREADQEEDNGQRVDRYNPIRVDVFWRAVLRILMLGTFKGFRSEHLIFV